MKSYLSLVSISAKKHRRQNRMTLFCIIISVFMVTVIFSMADLLTQSEMSNMLRKHGNWHIELKNITDQQADEIRNRPDVTAAGWCEVFNFNAEEDYYVGDLKAALYGTDEAYMLPIRNGLTEGAFPANDQEVMLCADTKFLLNVQIGDRITLRTPAGDREYTISGFGSDDPGYYEGQTFLTGVYLTRNAFYAIMDDNGVKDHSPSCYFQFQSAKAAARAIPDLRAQYHLSEDQIDENTAIMGLSGASSSESINGFLETAAVLFVLVLLAGVLMISGSLNSNVSQRTRFFGMMRCIGASRQQIIRFVRLEALNWCKTAIPAGVVLGVFSTWALCAALKFGIGGEFADVKVFAISITGAASGAAVGILTVLLAAQAPARRAAKVSPITAVTGGAGAVRTVPHAANTRFTKIDMALGIHHAVSAKKNWFLMTASFALTIVLFLGFSVGMDFARTLLPSLRSWQPDLNIAGYANALTLDRELPEQIQEMPGVEHAYGNIYMSDIPAHSEQSSIDHINLVSYDDYMLDCARESVTSGSMSGVYGDSDQVMTIYNRNNPLKVGDTIQVAGTELTVACALSDGLFADDLIVICSEETFLKLMGEQNYCMVSVQLGPDATEDTVNSIRALANKDQIFADDRESNQSTNATYWATRIVGYGFLAILGMITVFFIINSILLSVSARTKQYGAMRAVGMDGRQLSRMIAAEAFTYAGSGFLAGCVIGLPLSRALYTRLITYYLGKTWTVPFSLLVFLFLFVFAAAAISVYAPSKRILQMEINETINEL